MGTKAPNRPPCLQKKHGEGRDAEQEKQDHTIERRRRQCWQVLATFSELVMKRDYGKKERTDSRLSVTELLHSVQCSIGARCVTTVPQMRIAQRTCPVSDRGVPRSWTLFVRTVTLIMADPVTKSSTLLTAARKERL